MWLGVIKRLFKNCSISPTACSYNRSLGRLAPKYIDPHLHLPATVTIHMLAATRDRQKVRRANQRRKRRDAHSDAAQAREDVKTTHLDDVDPLKFLHSRTWAQEDTQAFQNTMHSLESRWCILCRERWPNPASCRDPSQFTSVLGRSQIYRWGLYKGISEAYSLAQYVASSVPSCVTGVSSIPGYGTCLYFGVCSLLVLQSPP